MDSSLSDSPLPLSRRVSAVVITGAVRSFLAQPHPLTRFFCVGLSMRTLPCCCYWSRVSASVPGAPEKTRWRRNRARRPCRRASCWPARAHRKAASAQHSQAPQGAAFAARSRDARGGARAGHSGREAR
jgi:hypothetical protein